MSNFRAKTREDQSLKARREARAKQQASEFQATQADIDKAKAQLGQLDRNRDRRLDKKEAAAAWGDQTDQIFAEHDLNRSGFLISKELARHLAKQRANENGQQQQQQKQQPSRVQFGQFTLRSNGGQFFLVQRQPRASPAQVEEFARYDHNQDGLISLAESRARLEPIVKGREFASGREAVIEPGIGASSMIQVDDDVLIEDLDVLVAMTKQNDHQTQISLVGPDQQSVTLFAGGWQPWSGALFESTLIDDDATLIETTLPRAPFPRRLRTDALKTDQPGLRRFHGKSARGFWRLVVRNQDDGVGVLHHWSLLLTPKKD